MPNAYRLTVVNNSGLDMPPPTFAVFADLPISSNYASLSAAWLTQPVADGNQYTFEWDITWGFAWSASGKQAGYIWSGSGKLPANPNSTSGCAATLTYEGGDFHLLPSSGTPDGSTLTITDSVMVPGPKTKPSMVAVTLNGEPVSVTNAGPNLTQTFTTHPTYYIDAGRYTKGQMVDASSVTRFQELSFTNGETALTAILQKDNTWRVEPTGNVDLATLT